VSEFIIVTCAHCWQTFEMHCDTSVQEQTLIYDCETCCNPLEITYQVFENQAELVSVVPAQ
jgi:membrane-bound inhibitor of C-type lysozyme